MNGQNRLRGIRSGPHIVIMEICANSQAQIIIHSWSTVNDGILGAFSTTHLCRLHHKCVAPTQMCDGKHRWSAGWRCTESTLVCRRPVVWRPCFRPFTYCDTLIYLKINPLELKQLKARSSLISLPNYRLAALTCLQLFQMPSFFFFCESIKLKQRRIKS